MMSGNITSANIFMEKNAKYPYSKYKETERKNTFFSFFLSFYLENKQWCCPIGTTKASYH